LGENNIGLPNKKPGDFCSLFSGKNFAVHQILMKKKKYLPVLSVNLATVELTLNNRMLGI
jgi:hypothetical protein